MDLGLGVQEVRNWKKDGFDMHGHLHGHAVDHKWACVSTEPDGFGQGSLHEVFIRYARFRYPISPFN
jgi:hypothetical protein